MTHRPRGALHLALVLLAMPSSAAGQSDPSPFTGCWDVRVGLWRAVTEAPVRVPRLPPDRSRDSTSYLLPPRIRLSSDVVRGRDDARWMRAAAPAGALPTGHRHQAWRPADGGGLELWFYTGEVGVGVRLDARGRALAGTLRTLDPVEGAQLYERDVTLERAGCSSPPPVSVDVLRPLPRVVELAGGAATITLGDLPPVGLSTSDRPSGAVGVAARSAGLFAGSDSIAYRVGRSDGRVGIIQLIFPPPATPDTLIDRIVRAWGPPDPDTGIPGGWWHSRITELSVIRYPEGGFRVLLQDPRSW